MKQGEVTMMDDMPTAQMNETIDQTKDIVAAYVSHNALSASDLPNLIGQVHAALAALTAPPVPEKAPQEPAVPVKRSVHPDHIVCLEDGKKFKTLKRHLRTEHDLSPDAYRAKWNLSADYPLVAPNYSSTRSALAREIGLGTGAPKKTAKARRARA
jgi:predicted transcriptional regulator